MYVHIYIYTYVCVCTYVYVYMQVIFPLVTCHFPNAFQYTNIHQRIKRNYFFFANFVTHFSSLDWFSSESISHRLLRYSRILRAMPDVEGRFLNVVVINIYNLKKRIRVI